MTDGTGRVSPSRNCARRVAEVAAGEAMEDECKGRGEGVWKVGEGGRATKKGENIHAACPQLSTMHNDTALAWQFVSLLTTSIKKKAQQYRDSSHVQTRQAVTTPQLQGLLVGNALLGSDVRTVI